MKKRVTNLGKWRIRQGPEGEWLLYPPGSRFPMDARSTFEKALHSFPRIIRWEMSSEDRASYKIGS